MVTTQTTTPPMKTAVPDTVTPLSRVGVTEAMGLLRSLAMRAITVHVSNVGSCSACGAPWPCQQARLAEHNLAVL
ncbi:MAG: hypothetical protein ACRDT0_26030 [Pseudonocardiaceae bacterium]